MGCFETKQKTEQQFSPYQQEIMKNLSNVYSPYVGAGTLGGLSDLEQNALNMLRSADVWSPLTTTGTGLLTGTLGAQKISPEMATGAFKNIIEKPATQYWEETVRPTVKEAYSGPGYWGGARASAESESAEDLAESLGTERANWMWDVEQANRAIDEAKAGRALSALTAYPSSMLGWASGISSIGRQAQEILNSITDPNVINVLATVLGTSPAGPRTTTQPYSFRDYLGMGGDVASIFAALP